VSAEKPWVPAEIASVALNPRETIESWSCQEVQSSFGGSGFRLLAAGVVGGSDGGVVSVGQSGDDGQAQAAAACGASVSDVHTLGLNV
jgi:hypothetical protein